MRAHTSINVAQVLFTMVAILLLSFSALSAYAQSPTTDPIVYTPYGETHADCVHVVPSGSIVSRDGDNTWVVEPDGTTIVYSPCSDPINPLISGCAANPNVEDANYNDTSGTYTGFFRANWTVPAAPSSQNGQLIWMWNGLEPYGCGWVIQSVLQWGHDDVQGVGGGADWQMESWYFESATDYVVSTPVTGVATGDSLTGEQSGYDCSSGNCNWSISIADSNLQESSYLNCATTSQSDVCDLAVSQSYIALEEWNFTGCNEFPGSSSSPTTFVSKQDSTTGSSLSVSWSYYVEGICSGDLGVTSTSGYTSDVNLYYS